MSIIGDIVKNAGKTIDKATEDILDEIERSPKAIEKLGQKAGLLGKRGFGELSPGNLWGAGNRGGGKRVPPAEYAVDDDVNEILDRFESTGECGTGALAKAKRWVVTSTIIIGAGALAADTDLGTTNTNPFSSTNSAFFTTAGVFPQPFLAYGISGTITATQPAAATEVASVLDAFYLSMRATTELARYSATRDLGYQVALQGNVAAAAATGAAMLNFKAYQSWRQAFDPRTTYVWGYRLPRGITSVGAITITQSLHGLLFEGGSVGRR